MHGGTDLAAAFGFTPGDLDANRAGALTAGQQAAVVVAAEETRRLGRRSMFGLLLLVLVVGEALVIGIGLLPEGEAVVGNGAGGVATTETGGLRTGGTGVRTAMLLAVPASLLLWLVVVGTVAWFQGRGARRREEAPTVAVGGGEVGGVDRTVPGVATAWIGDLRCRVTPAQADALEAVGRVRAYYVGPKVGPRLLSLEPAPAGWGPAAGRSA